MAKFPRFVRNLGAVVCFTIVSGHVMAERTPHGRPASLEPSSTLSLGIASGVDTNSAQYSVFLENRFTLNLMVFAELAAARGTLDDVAINGDLDVDISGGTYGLYYQLPDYSGTRVLIGLRVAQYEKRDDALIISGASRVNLTEESSAVEIAVLISRNGWNRGDVQPYAGAGIRVSDTLTDINAMGGRDIAFRELTENTAEFTAGIHYQHHRFSWFLEGNANTSESDPFGLYAGLRFAFL